MLDKLILPLLAGLALFVASPASAAVVAPGENRASGSTTGLTALIEIEALLSEEAVRENIPSFYDVASDNAVAARATAATRAAEIQGEPEILRGPLCVALDGVVDRFGMRDFSARTRP